jgi:hypothetical protein
MRDLCALEFALPRYLSDEKIDYLLKGLEDYPNMSNIYANSPPDYWMQGDIFKDIDYPYYVDGKYEIAKTDAMLISNTCDVSLDNMRDFYTSQLAFVPVANLQSYENGLLTKFSRERVKSHIDAIRKQGITSFFYIPPKSTHDQEKFARFDMVFSIYLKNMKITKEQLLSNRVLSFSNNGFYILLYKISRHFTRIFEAIDRG